jgi:hypothetical protein
MTPRTPAGRHLAATVAQYIHELSERHEKDREAVAVIPRVVVTPRTA